MALSRVQVKEQNNINAKKIKTPLFSSDERKKNGVLRVYCRVKGPNHLLGLGPWLRTWAVRGRENGNEWFKPKTQ